MLIHHSRVSVNLLHIYDSTLLAKDKTTEHWFQFWTTSPQLCLPRQFTIIGWSVSSRPNMPYRPHLFSYDVSETDMERQAPDTRHQAPHIPDTCLVCASICRRHLDFTISWCEDSGCFPPKVSEKAAWNPMVRPSQKWWSTTSDRSDFTVPSPILSMHIVILASGLTWWHTGKHGSSAPHQRITQLTSWRQVASPTWSSTEQVARPATKWLDPLNWRPLEACCWPWTWWCNNAPALAGYVTMILYIILLLYIITSLLPSVLWHCWLSVRKSILPVKNRVMRCWCSYLSGVRCRLLAYGPADGLQTHRTQDSSDPRQFCTSAEVSSCSDHTVESCRNRELTAEAL